jgi:phenylpropionate dioxygenase-like ring-hydroxylating dioxygenase large terminal subunit
MSVVPKFEPIFTRQDSRLDTAPLPYYPFYDQDFFDKEIERIFRRNWLFAARESDIPNAGDFVVKEFPALRTAVIIVRDKSGRINAFHNMCPHRGNRVEVEACGNRNRFVCSFHAWSFGHDGSLVNVPDRDAFFDLDTKTRGLRRVHVDSWLGMLFVNFDQGRVAPLAEWLGDLHGDLQGFPMPEFATMLKFRTELKCNWKMVMDAFLEAYHVVQLHAQSAGEGLTSASNPFGHLNSVRLYDKHKSLSAFGNPEQKPAGTTALEIKYQHAAAYAPIQGERYSALASAKWSGFPKGVNPDRRDDWGFDIHLLFPNCSFYTGNGWAVTQTYTPVTVETSIVESIVYMREPTTVGGFVGFEHMKAMVFDVALEDLSTVERAQSNVRSGAYDTMMLSDMEVVVRHSHQIIRNIVEKGLPS